MRFYRKRSKNTWWCVAASAPLTLIGFSVIAYVVLNFSLNCEWNFSAQICSLGYFWGGILMIPVVVGTAIGVMTLIGIWQDSWPEEYSIERLRQLGADVRKVGHGYEVVTGGGTKFFILYIYDWMELYVPDARLVQRFSISETTVSAPEIDSELESSRERKVISNDPKYASLLSDCLKKVIVPTKMDEGSDFWIEIEMDRGQPCWKFEWSNHQPNWTEEQLEYCVAIVECLLATPIPISDADDDYSFRWLSV